MNAIELGLFASRLSAVCDEMGAVLRRAALSPNIRDRLDYSCAVFDAAGGLCAQAAHIPVHLGSMAYAMADLVAGRTWADGDMLIVNDPFLGGTHLPDVTLIAPVFVATGLVGFVVNRAHHADIGASAPGSMPLSRSLAEEGVIIAPVLLLRAGRLENEVLDGITAATRNPDHARGDFLAQIAANRSGRERLAALAAGSGMTAFRAGLVALNDYGERLARAALRALPDGCYQFTDRLDDDGQGQTDLPVAVTLTVRDGLVDCDFTGTAAAVPGNLNCPLAVAAAAVFYCFRALMPAQTPACAGSLRPLRLHALAGCLIDARRRAGEPPAAVAAGNVETSQRIVDAVLGALAGGPRLPTGPTADADASPPSHRSSPLSSALPAGLAARLPAASHGSMNNLAIGGETATGPWDYYETIGGGMGAATSGGGLSGVQTHMTNTLNTPIEVIESRFPLRVRRYGLRRGSGGAGQRPGGDGLVREFEALRPAQATLIGERRRHAPWGLAGGNAGATGRQSHNGRMVPGKVALTLARGDRLLIETPGGGGWGPVPGPDDDAEPTAGANT